MKMPVPDAAMLESLRQRIGLQSDDAAQDADINQAYAMAVLWLEQYLDRILWTETGEVTESVPHYRGNTLSLRGYPVDALQPITVIVPSGEVPSYTADLTNGLLLFDRTAWLRDLTVTYRIVDILNGPLRYALLLVFDQMLAALQVTEGGANQAGPVKAISSDGSRIEFDTSGGSGATTRSIDPVSTFPVLTLGMLQSYRRSTC